MSVNEVPVEATFRDYGLKATKRFLKTAIVIDDEIIAEPPRAEDAPEANAPAFADSQAVESDPVAEGNAPNVADAEVAIKPLADAFLDKQIICGVLKPGLADDEGHVIERAVRAASVADVVIIDWYLRKTDDSLARSILEKILIADRGMNGRLRLVLVYTSADPLADRRNDLARHLLDAGFDTVEDADDDTLLTVGTCRIRFVKKRSLNTGTAVADLPDLAIEEFAKHSNGLLANFALLGIAALRDATHHILANLNRRMDSAFVGHRMLLGEGSGAHGFAMSLFMLQMKSVLSLPTHLGGALGDKELGAWFDDRFSYANADQHLASAGVEKAMLRDSVLKGTERLEAPHKALFLSETVEPTDVAKTEKAVSQDFARLATFVRELDGFNPLPERWLPTLTLGSVVKLKDRTSRYFLCVQPACDTVRIDEERYFPFVELVVAKTNHSTENLVIRDGARTLVVAVNSKPGSRYYAKFKADEAVKSVKAEEVDGKFVFSSTHEFRYWWLGDIDPIKAQRIAVDLSSTLARVGINEYEWLRRGGNLKK
ncbi:hypothetical protein HJA87_05005 [Rhizobium bangladeshense]|uniref:Response receiver domain-containing protein n=1 Tax=Rhizobium bangladeshense TaxID=1138189 RepID=A0ABS7LDC4_9HYPH|nr:response regulator receiver domain [Rhizobium bangladeshense]MBX4902413.1 hypothetical protein [Rhizobium bangladeshense]MBY3589243.1 hypothetical protein [Rhizobium bangladeshense]